MFKTILVPSDGSPLSEKAVSAAAEFAKQYGGRIVGISVAQPYPLAIPAEGSSIVVNRTEYEDEMRRQAQQTVQKIAAAAAAVNVPCETVVAESPDPYEEIIKAATRFGCDVIFMASHGRKGLSRLFVGSETQKVLANSSIPVLVFR